MKKSKISAVSICGIVFLLIGIVFLSISLFSTISYNNKFNRRSVTGQLPVQSTIQMKSGWAVC